MSDPVDAATHRVAEAPHAPPAKTSVQPTKDTAVSPGNWSDPEKELHDIEDALVELETAMKDVASLTSKGASKSALSGPDREKLVSARDLLDQAKKTELGRRGSVLRATGLQGRSMRFVSDQQRADERCCSVRRSRVGCIAVMDMVTNNGAKALRVPEFGVAVGAVADLVVLDANDAREAFATMSPRRWVIRKGKLIAETRLEVCRHFDISATPPA
jgi:hypothetical protein